VIPISEFAALCGVTTRTIERHLADGRIVPAARTKGGHARFDPAQAADYRKMYRWGGIYDYKGRRKRPRLPSLDELMS
jgi:DNA-binding transcriptional MerR regulator